MLDLPPSHRPGRPSPEDASTGTARPPRLRLRLRLSTSLRHPVPRPLCDRLPADQATGTASPKPPPRQPQPGRPRLALNLILAKTSPQTNLNLPQEKHGTAQLRLRLRLRLRTSLRHPVPRPLCDRLLTTHRPATLAPKPPPRQTQPRRPPPAPGLAAFRENRRQTTATQWRGYTV